MSIDQRRWWHAGDAARDEDVAAGNLAADADEATVRAALETADLVAYFGDDLHSLSESEQIAALEAAEHGYVHGRPGGYGQPSWLDAHAGEVAS